MPDDRIAADEEFESEEIDEHYWFRRPVLRGIATASGIGLVGPLNTGSVRAVQTEQQTTDFTWSPDPPAPGDPVTFTSTATDPGGEINLYSWDFDDDGAQDASGRTATHTFETSGNYDVTHAVLYGFERIETVSKTVTVASGRWRQVAKLLASDGEGGDHFGRAVSLSGDTALVGVINPQLAYRKAGSAYVFVRSGGTWSEQTKFAPSDAESRDMFGEAVSLDGDTAVVGARGDDDMGPNSGAAYVFTRSDGSWRRQTKLTPSERRDRFGRSVSVDGDTIVVGEWGSARDSVATVFTRSGGMWSQQATLSRGDGGQSGSGYSRQVSVSGDTALVSASAEDLERSDGTVDTAAGAVFVFSRSGGVWSQQAKLVASDAEEGNEFGFSTDVDGDTAIVGVRGKDDRGVRWLGAAYVFTRSGTDWSQQAKLSPDDLPPDQEFGELFGKAGVGIDGDTAVVAAAGSTGKVYVYDRSDTTWTRRAILVEEDPLPYPAINASEFANSVAIDANSVIVGAHGHDETAPGAGAAFVYEP